MTLTLPSKLNKAQQEYVSDMKSWGIPVEEFTQADIEELWSLGGKRQEKEKPKPTQEPRREAELVMRTLQIPTGHVVECSCGRRFLTNYHYERFCSEDCLRASLRERGIDRDMTRSETERWFPYEPPSRIGPAALLVLVKQAHWILEQWEQVSREDAIKEIDALREELEELQAIKSRTKPKPEPELPHIQSAPVALPVVDVDF